MAHRNQEIPVAYGDRFPPRRPSGQEFFGTPQSPPGEPTVEKGYYTQDDIREIVAYAGERHIEVIPEIEMPAHSNPHWLPIRYWRVRW